MATNAARADAALANTAQKGVFGRIHRHTMKIGQNDSATRRSEATQRNRCESRYLI